uniref:Uncharacterized protein n=1 Tax=Haptolina ericina TaxID=156174 RepID=A0A7S3ASW4_9EUKA
MSKDDFKRQREELEHKEALQKMRKATEKASEDRPDGDKPKKKAKKEKKRPGALSFEDELEAEAEPSPTIAPKKMGKCQDVNASFLGKNEREKEEEAAKQEQVLRDYLLEQQKAKDEPLTLAYTYRSEVTQRELPNAVHKGIIEVKRGFTAEQVARAVHLDTERLGEKFQGKRVAGIRVEERDVMLIANAGESPCGAFIIPPTMTMIEMSAVRWAEGTPLFELGPGIIVTEMKYYESWKHTYPYSHWNPYESRLTYSHKEFIANRNSGTGIDPVRISTKPGAKR